MECREELTISKHQRTYNTRHRCASKCTSVNKAKKILEAIFTIILSRYDGDILHSDKSNKYNERQLTPCAKSKKYLKDLIKFSDQLENF